MFGWYRGDNISLSENNCLENNSKKSIKIINIFVFLLYEELIRKYFVVLPERFIEFKIIKNVLIFIIPQQSTKKELQLLETG